MDFLQSVAKERGASNTTLATAPGSDSKANGEAENAVQSIEQMISTLMVGLEERCGEKLSVEGASFAWLVEHACDLTNRFKVRTGGKTAWGIIKAGRALSAEVYHVGAPVMHRISGPVQGGVVHERWHDGIWLGQQFTSGEHIWALTDGRFVCARSVHPKPDSARPTKAALINIQTGPWGATGVITQDTRAVPPPSLKCADPSSGPSSQDLVPRGLRITKDLLE